MRKTHLLKSCCCARSIYRNLSSERSIHVQIKLSEPLTVFYYSPLQRKMENSDSASIFMFWIGKQSETTSRFKQLKCWLIKPKALLSSSSSSCCRDLRDSETLKKRSLGPKYRPRVQYFPFVSIHLDYILIFPRSKQNTLILFAK